MLLLVFWVAFTDGVISLRGIGYLALVFTSLILVRSGGPLLDALGVWQLAGFLFVGVASLIIKANEITAPGLEQAAFLSSIVLIISTGTVFAFRTQRAAIRPQASLLTLPSGVFIWLGIATFAWTLAATTSPALRSLPLAFTWLAPVLLLIGFLSRSRERRFAPLILIAVAAAYVVALSQWDGFGRLSILGGFLIAYLTWQAAAGPQSWLPKTLLILAMAPALYLAGLIETNRKSSSNLLSSTENFEFGDGLSSLTSPLSVCADIIRGIESGILQYRGFEIVFNALMAPIPRELWSDKPGGTGREIVLLLRERYLAATIHSEATMITGDLYWSGGLVAVVLGALALGYAIYQLDRLQRLMTTALMPRGVVPIWLLPSTILVGFLPTLFWTGFFSYSARVWTQLLPLGLLYIGAFLLVPPSRTQRLDLVQNEPRRPAGQFRTLSTTRRT